MVKQKIKKLLIELANHTCENCRKVFKEDTLCIHRIRRGNIGGTYYWRNCMVLCKECHKKMHQGEF